MTYTIRDLCNRFADTIRPRLDLLKADVGLVYFLDVVREKVGRDVALDLDRHIDHFDDWLKQHPEVRLVILDPLAAFLGGVDANRNNEVRTVLGRLAKVAEKYGVAVIAIQHLTKALAKSLHRSLGSIAFVAAARAVWQVSADRDEPGRRLFLPVKMNLAASSGLAFQVSDNGITWEEGHITISADDAEAEEGQTPRAEARAWLKDLMRNGPVPARDVELKAKDDGIPACAP